MIEVFNIAKAYKPISMSSTMFSRSVREKYLVCSTQRCRENNFDADGFNTVETQFRTHINLGMNTAMTLEIKKHMGFLTTEVRLDPDSTPTDYLTISADSIE